MTTEGLPTVVRFDKYRGFGSALALPGSPSGNPSTIGYRLVYRLRSPAPLVFSPGNRVEVLKGNRAGQYSIRINDQWRVCFRWTEAGAEDVEIVDYH